jgi:hypothetical protein
MQLAWVSCAKSVSKTASESRHLIVPGSLTTLCGNTASHVDVWRRNRNKPACTYCAQALEEMGKSKTMTVSFSATIEQKGDDAAWAHILDGLTVDELLELIRAAVNKVKRLRLIGNDRKQDQ